MLRSARGATAASTRDEEKSRLIFIVDCANDVVWWRVAEAARPRYVLNIATAAGVVLL